MNALLSVNTSVAGILGAVVAAIVAVAAPQANTPLLKFSAQKQVCWGPVGIDTLSSCT